MTSGQIHSGHDGAGQAGLAHNVTGSSGYPCAMRMRPRSQRTPSPCLLIALRLPFERAADPYDLSGGRMPCGG
jgi:hypothetical protein